MFSATTAKLAGRRPSTFYNDVINGLRAENKYLPSKYFYDEAGDKLFQQIMACPEYYRPVVRWRSCNISRVPWPNFSTTPALLSTLSNWGPATPPNHGTSYGSFWQQTPA